MLPALLAPHLTSLPAPAPATRLPALQQMSKGYIQSTEKIRDRLLIGEWELARKGIAKRRQAPTANDAAACCCKRHL